MKGAYVTVQLQEVNEELQGVPEYKDLASRYSKSSSHHPYGFSL